MKMTIGANIKRLRTAKKITQEQLSAAMNVTCAAVSKWERGSTLPDVTMIPAIASFFGVSTDELFDFNLYEIEKNVAAIVDEHSKYWYTDKEKAEEVIRGGLKKYPGNDVLLDCLIGVPLRHPRTEECLIPSSLKESVLSFPLSGGIMALGRCYMHWRCCF